MRSCFFNIRVLYVMCSVNLLSQMFLSLNNLSDLVPSRLPFSSCPFSDCLQAQNTMWCITVGSQKILGTALVQLLPLYQLKSVIKYRRSREAASCGTVYRQLHLAVAQLWDFFYFKAVLYSFPPRYQFLYLWSPTSAIEEEIKRRVK